jgi:hypothetical protein
VLAPARAIAAAAAVVVVVAVVILSDLVLQDSCGSSSRSTAVFPYCAPDSDEAVAAEEEAAVTAAAVTAAAVTATAVLLTPSQYAVVAVVRTTALLRQFQVSSYINAYTPTHNALIPLL